MAMVKVKVEFEVEVDDEDGDEMAEATMAEFVIQGILDNLEAGGVSGTIID